MSSLPNTASARLPLAGRLAVVTGGASGIGLGIARALTRVGAGVVIAHRTDDRLQTAADALRSGGSSVMSVEMDVTDRQSVSSAAEEIAAKFGDVHVLCNSAGVNQIGAIDESSYEDWDWIMGVNVGGVINCLQTFIPRMKAHRQGGHVLNVGSMSSFIPSLHAGIYVASKFAVRGLTESLRLSLARHGIAVSLVCPGLTHTDIWRSSLRKPAQFRRDEKVMDEATMARLEHVHAIGMDPAQVGELAVQGMLRNDFYIFTHAEFNDELEEMHGRVRAGRCAVEVEPRRGELERARRKASVEAWQLGESLTPFRRS